MKKRVRLTEGHLHNIIRNYVRQTLKESFEDDYNKARNNYQKPLWGFEMKNKEGEWEYGEVSFDPTEMTMTCMGVSINVDPDQSVDENLYNLYAELRNNGYRDGDEYEEELNESRLNRIVKTTVRRFLTEGLDNDEKPDWSKKEGTLSHLATQLISNDAAILRKIRNIDEIKNFIKSKVEVLNHTSTLQKHRFLYGDGSGQYYGLMGAHSINEIYSILGQMALGGNGYGLTKTGLAKRR
jgi:hypothetical protein